LAFASLSEAGYPIRLSGQDSQRGTFSQRHAVLHDIVDGKTWMPLEHISGDQARIEIYNSPLSENSVLGFEYGYSLESPKGLVLWEAQFGDFVNVAQPLIDQFIVSSEDKWSRFSGLIMLLPHGFEGMGPEHSSAHLERFLAQAAEDNIQVVNVSTPAQYFHLLRRQVLRTWRKPLIVMTPKSLLRSPRALSPITAFTTPGFQRILADTLLNATTTTAILLCSGKIYYELEEERERLKRLDIAILRIEQLYPLNPATLAEALAPYADNTPVTWVQEEPENMGAWRYLLVRFGERLLERFPFRGVQRPASASPATGSSNRHLQEQKQILAKAFGP
jgi:2-oxoglutarate dehydrogenase E1 component